MLYLKAAICLAVVAAAGHDCGSGDAACPATAKASNVSSVTSSSGAHGTQLIQRRKAVAVAVSHDIEVPLHCDSLSEGQCSSRSDCNYTNNISQCHVLISWWHPPKCAGSFGTTLAHFANSSIPAGAHMPGNTNESDPEDMLGPTPPGEKERQGEDYFFNYKYPYYEWFQDCFAHAYWNPGNHVPISDEAWDMWHGNYYGLFRQPEQRIVSSYNHFADGSGDILQYSKRLWGQQTAMLSGRGTLDHWAKVQCEFDPLADEWEYVDIDLIPPAPTSASCDESVEDDLPLAIERLQTGFRFVGLVEEYDLSVCLFHKMFGGECYENEFINMRAGADDKEDSKLDLMVMLEEEPDPYDNKVYEVAEEIFWDNVKQYDVSRTTCAITCPSVPEVWEIDASVSLFQEANPTAHGYHRSKLRRKELVGEDTGMEYDWPGRLNYHE